MWRSRRGRGAGSAAGRGAARGTLQPCQRREAAQAASAAEPADAPACGWYESSRLLREGAAVHEHVVLDPIVNELPLAWWVEWAGLATRGRRP